MCNECFHVHFVANVVLYPEARMDGWMNGWKHVYRYFVSPFFFLPIGNFFSVLE